MSVKQVQAFNTIFMQAKINLETVLQIIDHADLEGCSETVKFINNLNFYHYSQEELKLISERLGERLKVLLHQELQDYRSARK